MEQFSQSSMLKTEKHNKFDLAISVSYKTDLWNLIEFIEYHRLVGVEHIYLCNNDDNPTNSSRILAHYVDEGFVTNLHTVKRLAGQRNRQAAAHAICLSLAKNNARWLALLDMDEFLFPLNCDKVTEVMKHYTDCQSVAFHYTCFGSSELKYRPELQTQSYFRRAPFAWNWNRLCKAIGQTDHVHNVLHHHFFNTNTMCDEEKKKCGWVKPYMAKNLRVNHYMSRSREDYAYKMIRGNPFNERRDWSWFTWADRNEVYDDSMKRFAGPLRDALERRKVLFHRSRRRVTYL